MATTKIILQGGGGHARVVLDVLLSQGALVPVVVDAKYQGDLMGIRRITDYDPSIERDASVIIAIGDNSVRKNVAGLTKHGFANVIHDSAVVIILPAQITEPSPISIAEASCNITDG